MSECNHTAGGMRPNVGLFEQVLMISGGEFDDLLDLEMGEEP